MRIRTWDPFRDVDELMGRYPAFSRVMQRWMGEGDEAASWAPQADISETAKEYVIKADLPGVKKDDVKVAVTDGRITLSGERKEAKTEKGENQIRVERFYGQFSRSFSLPEDIDPAHIEAKSENGTLTVHIPKKPGAKPKAVAIPVK
jgi:HSP20 family protein